MISKVIHFEDYEIGEEWETSTRTISEPDIYNFAYISGDYASAHVDAFAASKAPYQRRISHAIGGAALIHGMISCNVPHLSGRDMRGVYPATLEVNYRQALLLGDTIKLWCRIAEKSELPDGSSFGIVKTEFKLINQEEKTIYDGFLAIKARKKSAENALPDFRPVKAEDVKEIIPDFGRVYFAEDFAPGEGGSTCSRVITEADIVNFMGLTADYDNVYLDDEWGRQTLYQGRTVPWLLVAAIGTGLIVRDGWWLKIKRPSGGFAGHLRDTLTFVSPAKIGDRIQGLFKIMSIRQSRSKPDRSLVEMRRQCINQKREVLVSVDTIYMLMSKEGGAMHKDYKIEQALQRRLK